MKRECSKRNRTIVVIVRTQPLCLYVTIRRESWRVRDLGRQDELAVLPDQKDRRPPFERGLRFRSRHDLGTTVSGCTRKKTHHRTSLYAAG
jgi:hypothetical protein